MHELSKRFARWHSVAHVKKWLWRFFRRVFYKILVSFSIIYRAAVNLSVETLHWLVPVQ